MIPILYDSTETVFASNGLGRLRDCIDCKCSEERNGIYEVDFSYPVDGANYDLIQCGRIIGVTHDETGDIEPFDIVSYSKPVSGVVSFHAVHISYRQRGIVARGTNINSLADAFAVLTSSAQPSNPFTYEADFTSSAYASNSSEASRAVSSTLMAASMNSTVFASFCIRAEDKSATSRSVTELTCSTTRTIQTTLRPTRLASLIGAEMITDRMLLS